VTALDFEPGSIEPHLHMNLRLREVPEGHGGESFEVAGLVGQAAFGQQRLDGVGDGVEGGSELGVAGGDALHRDALVDADQVGRGVEPGAVVCLPQDGVHQGGHRALAVGAGNMDGDELSLRVAEAFQYGADVVQVPLQAAAFVP